MVFKYCPDCGDKCGEKEIGDEDFVLHVTKCYLAFHIPAFCV